MFGDTGGREVTNGRSVKRVKRDMNAIDAATGIEVTKIMEKKVLIMVQKIRKNMDE